MTQCLPSKLICGQGRHIGSLINQSTEGPKAAQDIAELLEAARHEAPGYRECLALEREAMQPEQTVKQPSPKTYRPDITQRRGEIPAHEVL
jgi:hypothetical protein